MLELRDDFDADCAVVAHGREAVRHVGQRDFRCVPIVGARTTEQLEENLGMTEISLSDEQFDRIGEAYE